MILLLDKGSKSQKEESQFPMQRSSYLTGSVHVPVFQNLGSLKAAPRAARGCSMQTSNIKVVSLPTVARTLRLPACPFRIGIVVGDIESEGK